MSCNVQIIVHKCVCAGASLLPQHCGLQSSNPEIQFGGNPVLKGKETIHVFFRKDSKLVGGNGSFVSNDSTKCVQVKIFARFTSLKLKEGGLLGRVLRSSSNVVFEH